MLEIINLLSLKNGDCIDAPLMTPVSLIYSFLNSVHNLKPEQVWFSLVFLSLAPIHELFIVDFLLLHLLHKVNLPYRNRFTNHCFGCKDCTDRIKYTLFFVHHYFSGMSHSSAFLRNI